MTAFLHGALAVRSHDYRGPLVRSDDFCGQFIGSKGLCLRSKGPCHYMYEYVEGPCHYVEGALSSRSMGPCHRDQRSPVIIAHTFL